MSGVKRYRVRLKADTPAAVRSAIGHRLRPDGIRMRLTKPPAVDTPVEVCITYADDRTALLGIGWVSQIDARDTHIEVEWEEASDPHLLTELFGMGPPAVPKTVTLEELDFQDEVSLVPSSTPGEAILHPELGWTVVGGPSSGVPEVVLGPSTDPLDQTPEEVSTAPHEVDVYDESTPFALTDVVEDAQAELDELEDDEPPTDRWRAPDLPPISGPSSSSSNTPLARIELVQKRVHAGGATAELVRADAEPLPLPTRRAPANRAPSNGPILALDLGTAMTRVAVSQSADARSVPLESNSEAMPSAVALEPDGATYVGAPALQVLAQQPSWGVLGIKRLLGRSYWSPTLRRLEAQLNWEIRTGAFGDIDAQIGARALSIEDGAAVLIRRAVRRANETLGTSANRVVLTCPSYFGVRQRSALVHAAETAGVYPERVLSVGTATALHHAWTAPNEGRRRRLLVFDLGAGTLDVSVIETNGRRFTSLASGGHPLLGGIDFDAAVVQLLVDAMEVSGTPPDPTPDVVTDMLEAAESGKHALGETSKIHLPVRAETASRAPAQMSVEIARDDAEALWAALVDKALSVTRDVCRRGGVAPMEIDEILVTGGQGRAPYVAQRLTEFFRRPCTLMEAPGAAALGAALAANQPDLILEDSLPCSLSAGGLGGTVVPVVARDQLFPAVGELRWSLPPSHPAEIFLFEGDHAHVEGCEPFGRICLETVPAERDEAIELELHASLHESGKVDLQVLRTSTGTLVPYHLEPSVPTDLVLHALAATPSPDAVGDHGEGHGFFDWLRKKLRR